MDIKQRIVKLLDQKRNIKNEIANIRSKCTHSDKVIKQVQLSNTSFNPRWVCSDCDLLLGYPTKFELDKLSEKKH